MKLTEKAAEKIKSHVNDFDAYNYLRIGVRAGGCSGFQYEMFWDDKSGPNDVHIGQYGVTLIIDNESWQYLKEATLDWKEGLLGAGFVWDNPNAKRSCGCGKSFS